MQKNNKRLLIVDDDKQITELLAFDITQSGYITDTAIDGQEGLKKALENNYDLILLDVMMPKMNGYEVCHNIRIAKPDVPILMLTAKGTIEDKTQGFDCGADDYLIKPFDFKELEARIRTLLRMNYQQNPSVLITLDLSLNTNSKKVYIDNTEIELTRKEYSILEYFYMVAC